MISFFRYFSKSLTSIILPEDFVSYNIIEQYEKVNSQSLIKASESLIYNILTCVFVVYLAWINIALRLITVSFYFTLV